MMWVYLLGIAFLVLCLTLALRYLRRKRLIDDLPTSKVHGVFIGQCELKGTAESGAPLFSYLAGTCCVYYNFTVEEHWSRTTVYVTSKGPQVRHESGWRNVAEDTKSVPFYLQDDTGAILVRPDGAELYTTVVFEQECQPSDPLYFGKGPLDETSNSSHRRRFREVAIPLHAALYVTGQARERTDVVAPEIAIDKNAPLFVISTRSEKRIGKGYLFWLWLWFILGLLTSVGLAAFYNYGQVYPSGSTYFIAGGIYLSAFLLGWLLTVFNSLVRLRNRVRQAWSQIDIQLKRRNDLIPRLSDCISSYASYERGLQTAQAELRSQAETGWEKARGLTATLIAVSEKYPELKASDQFLKLQKELAGTEERISLARAYYNDIVTFYDTRLATIPDRWVCASMGMKPASLWQAEGFEHSPVTVQLQG
jgi:hypothetical protein